MGETGGAGRGEEVAQDPALDARRRRARFRAWHRGIREMDLILGPFADATVSGLREGDLTAFELLLDRPDPELFAAIAGLETMPDHPAGTTLIARLAAFHADPRRPSPDR